MVIESGRGDGKKISIGERRFFHANEKLYIRDEENKDKHLKISTIFQNYNFYFIIIPDLDVCYSSNQCLSFV